MTILNVGTAIKDDKGNRYLLDELIGQGGFAYVFKAHRETDGKIFAVKTMLPSFGDPALAQSFQNEIQMAAKVHGDHIIRYEYVHNGSAFPEFQPYIIMEYADGGTLDKIIGNKKSIGKPFSNEELIAIFMQLAEGMRQINSALVHRDIKPANILLCGSTLKISDFGISKLAAEATRTQSFKGAGTLMYMAPEAWDWSKNTIQMDIYSMGIIFYELAALRYPYNPIPRTYEDCKSAHLLSPVTSITNSSISPSIISLINRMLEKSTKRRFSSWDEIIKMLESDTVPASPMDRFVANAVAIQNAEDTARQKREADARRRKKEEEDSSKLISFQIKQTVLAPIETFVEKVNQQYAGERKLRLTQTSSMEWELSDPTGNSLTICMQKVREQLREVSYNDFGRIQRRSETYIPKFRGKAILAWGMIENRAEYGFNLLLVDSGDLYGDWIIMNNKNNFSHGTNKARNEPFAFSWDELPNEVRNEYVTHLYTSEYEPFDDISFMGKIQQLLYYLTQF